MPEDKANKDVSFKVVHSAVSAETKEVLSEVKFEQIFKLYFTPLFLFARKYLHDEDLSKEIVHGVFVNMWEKRKAVDLSKSIKSYLFTSVYNRCMNAIRDRKKFVQENEHLEFVSENGIDASEEMEQAEVEGRINNAINELPEKCKEVFCLNRFEGLKYKEIAEKLGISVKTVENQMGKALKVLREKLKDLAPLWILILMS